MSIFRSIRPPDSRDRAVADLTPTSCQFGTNVVIPAPDGSAGAASQDLDELAVRIADHHGHAQVAGVDDLAAELRDPLENPRKIIRGDREVGEPRLVHDSLAEGRVASPVVVQQLEGE